MKLQNSILGSKTNLLLYHNENGPILPASSTVKLYRATPDVSPYFTLVSTTNVLTAGGLIDTGVYGIQLDTSAETIGTMTVIWDWTSSDTSYTYHETASFDIVENSLKILNYISSVSSNLQKRPFPDNARILNIAKILGVEDNWQSTFFNPVQWGDTAKNTADMVSKIYSKAVDTNRKVTNVKEETRRTIQSFNDKEMSKNVNKIINDLNSAIVTFNNNIQSSISSEGQSGKRNTIKAFDIWGQQVATLFSKVDVALTELDEIKTNQSEFAQAIPIMVSREIEGLMTNIIKQMINPNAVNQQVNQ